MTQIDEIDPLEAFESRPSVSFDASRGGYAKKQVARFIVQDFGKLIVDRDPETKEVNYWPLRDGETERRPKQKYVLNVLDVTGEEEVEKTLWAKPVRKGKALFAALVAAQKKVREQTGDKTYRLKPGDELQLCYLGDDTSVPAKMGNHPKMFAAKIVPGKEAPPSDDPFADDAPSSSDDGIWGNDGDGNSGAVPSTTRQPDADPFSGSYLGEDEPPF